VRPRSIFVVYDCEPLRGLICIRLLTLTAGLFAADGPAVFSRFELAVEPSAGQIIALRHGEQVRGCPSLYSSCSDGCEDGVRSNISGPNSSVSRCRNAAAAVCTAAACFYF